MRVKSYPLLLFFVDGSALWLDGTPGDGYGLVQIIDNGGMFFELTT